MFEPSMPAVGEIRGCEDTGGSPEMRWTRGMTADAASLHSLNSPIFLGRSPARTDLNHVGLKDAMCRYAGEINKLQYTHFHVRDFLVHFVRHLRGRWVWSRMRSRGPAELGHRKTRFSGNLMEPIRRSGTLPPSTFIWCSSAIAMPRRDMSHQRTNVCLWISPSTQRLQRWTQQPRCSARTRRRTSRLGPVGVDTQVARSWPQNGAGLVDFGAYARLVRFPAGSGPNLTTPLVR